MNRQLAARAEAAAWITRLHGPNRTPEMEAGFRRWLNESEDNKTEFEGLTDIWAVVGTMPAAGRGRRKTRWQLALAAAVLPLVFVALWLFRDSLEPAYVTDIGEGRMVQLQDKSRIWMNSDTRLRVAFDRRQRRVELIRGEALFEVARNESTPFVVAVGGHAVTALGTSFVVRYEASHTAVTLVEGKVAVSGAWILSAGQRLTLPPAGEPTIDEPSVESVLAWRRGEVVLNDTPLREAVSEMNRYDKTTIVVEGSALETLNISGLFHTGDNEGFARSVAKMYHLDLHERDGRIYLNSR
jgi:transmembrane sensor